MGRRRHARQTNHHAHGRRAGLARRSGSHGSTPPPHPHPPTLCSPQRGNVGVSPGASSALLAGPAAVELPAAPPAPSPPCPPSPPSRCCGPWSPAPASAAGRFRPRQLLGRRWAYVPSHRAPSSSGEGFTPLFPPLVRCRALPPPLLPPAGAPPSSAGPHSSPRVLNAVHRGVASQRAPSARMSPPNRAAVSSRGPRHAFPGSKRYARPADGQPAVLLARVRDAAPRPPPAPPPRGPRATSVPSESWSTARVGAGGPWLGGSAGRAHVAWHTSHSGANKGCPHPRAPTCGRARGAGMYPPPLYDVPPPMF